LCWWLGVGVHVVVSVGGGICGVMCTGCGFAISIGVIVGEVVVAAGVGIYNVVVCGIAGVGGGVEVGEVVDGVGVGVDVCGGGVVGGADGVRGMSGVVDGDVGWRGCCWCRC